MARQLKLNINAAPEDFRKRLSLQYLRLGLELVWCEIDTHTNRIVKERKYKRRRYDKEKETLQEKQCISCHKSKPRTEYDIVANTGRMRPACRECDTAPVRTCHSCKITKGVDEYEKHSRWTCKTCKLNGRIAYRERTKK